MYPYSKTWRVNSEKKVGFLEVAIEINVDVSKNSLNFILKLSELAFPGHLIFFTVIKRAGFKKAPTFRKLRRYVGAGSAFITASGFLEGKSRYN